jgi:hypothetical protein
MTKKMKQQHLILVGILVVVLVAAGAFALKMKGVTPPGTPAVTGGVAANGNDAPVIPPDGSKPPLEYQKQVLNVPDDKAPDSEKLKYFELAQTLARDADYLEIKNDCDLYPLVLYSRLGSSIKIRNSGDNNAIIQVNNDHRYEIPARETKTITADFGSGQGIYGYSCNESPKAMGIFFVAPK